MHLKNLLTAAILAGMAGGASAQQAAAPAPAPAAPPAWKQGMSPEQEKSTLHPFAGHVTGRMASDLPLNKITAPAGFKVETYADGVPDARSLALGSKGTVFVSNRVQSRIYAIVDKDESRRLYCPHATRWFR